MNVQDFGGLIWAVFILIAVISSVVRSARRTAGRAQQSQLVQSPPAPARVPSRYQPDAVAPSAQPRVSLSPETSLRTGVSKGAPGKRFVVPLPVRPAPPEAAPALAMLSFVAPRPRALSVGSVFERGSPVARGIIALEVLGPPRALREWSSIV